MFTPILTIELPVGAGRVLSVSAFDAVVLLVFIGLCRPYRPAGLRPVASRLWPFGLFAALAVAHSAAFLVLGSDLQLPGLVRETVKYVGFVATVAMLVMIFRTAPMDAPPPRETLAGAALVIGLGAMVFTWSPIAIIGGSHATVIGSMLTVIAMLLVGATEERGHPRDTVLTAIALAAALTGVWALWSKLFILCVAACALVFGARRIGVRVARPWLAVALGAGVLAVLMAWLYTQQAWRFDISASVRIELWGAAADLAARSFPWGIGLGQFGSWLAAINYQGGEVEPIRFVHNQFLAFLTEAGVVGIGLGLIVVKVVIDGASVWRDSMALVFVGVFLGALTLHDAIGLRALQLLLGYSLAVALRPGIGGRQRRRVP